MIDQIAPGAFWPFRLWGSNRAKDRKRLPENTVVYAIGDMHGCLDLLERAIDEIAEDQARRDGGKAFVVTLGDYIDRGPQSAAVVDRLSSNPFGAATHIPLLGNHEEAMLGFLQDPERWAPWLGMGGMATLSSYGIEEQGFHGSGALRALAAALAKAVPQSHRSFLEGLVTHWSIGDYFFVHAGIRPEVPLESQSIDDLLTIRGPFLRWSRPFPKIVVHGHTPVDNVDFRSNRINIDTGACFTGRLSVLALTNEGAEVLRIERRGRTGYAQRAWERSNRRTAVARADKGNPASGAKTAAGMTIAAGLALFAAGVERTIASYEDLQPVGVAAMAGRVSSADGSKRALLSTRIALCKANYRGMLGKVDFAKAESAYRACQQEISRYVALSPADPYGWLKAAQFSYEADGAGAKAVELLTMAYETGTNEGSGIADRIVLGYQLDEMIGDDMRARRRGDLENTVRYRIDIRPFLDFYLMPTTRRGAIQADIEMLSVDAQDYLVVAIGRAIDRGTGAKSPDG